MEQGEEGEDIGRERPDAIDSLGQGVVLEQGPVEQCERKSVAVGAAETLSEKQKAHCVALVKGVGGCGGREVVEARVGDEGSGAC